MKSEHAPKRARLAAAIALMALALPGTGCFALSAAAAKENQAPPPERTAPPIPEPGMLQDEALEKELVDRLIAKGKIVAGKIVFPEDDWSIQRNENSGVVETRSANATLLFKKQDGTCSQDRGLLIQQYVGDEFIAPGEWALLVTEPYDIPCEKAGL